MSENTRWWLSFAAEDGFLGAVIVEAPDFINAVMKTHMLGINPGGEVAGYECPSSFVVDHADLDRLMARAELEKFNVVSLKEGRDQGLGEPQGTNLVHEECNKP